MIDDTDGPKNNPKYTVITSKFWDVLFTVTKKSKFSSYSKTAILL